MLKLPGLLFLIIGLIFVARGIRHKKSGRPGTAFMLGIAGIILGAIILLL